MARIRTIKPEFWSSEQVMECSPVARLLFIGLWNFCDDAGNHGLSLKTIKAEIFPADDIHLSSIRQLLDELSSNSLIVYYSHENKDFLHVTGWHHQKIEKKSFKHPAYRSGSSDVGRRMVVDSSTPEWKGEEGKEKEGNGEEGSQEGNQPAADLLGGIVPSESTIDPCQVILEAYHRLLPKCERISVINPKRRRRMLEATKLAKALCKDQDWQWGAAWFWDCYFGECAKDAWMRGEVPNPNSPRWKQNLDVLIAEDRFAKVMDAAIAAMERAA